LNYTTYQSFSNEVFAAGNYDGIGNSFSWISMLGYSAVVLSIGIIFSTGFFGF